MGTKLVGEGRGGDVKEMLGGKFSKRLWLEVGEEGRSPYG